MNRRTLLKSAAATAGSLMITRPPLASAATLNRGVWASLFDGATKLQNDGTLGGCPASSPYGMVSYWYSYPGSWTSTNQVILGQTVPAGPQNLEIYHLITGSTKHPGTPNIALYAVFSTGSTPTSTGYVMAFTPAGTFLPASGYNLIQLSWDLTVPRVKATINRQPVPLGLNFAAPYANGIQYNTWGGAPLNWVVGGGIFQGGGYFKGNLAELYAYFLSSPPPDINDPVVQDGFSAAGKPPPFEHLTQDGSSALQEENPQIYLSGPAGVLPYSGKRAANTRLADASALQSIISVNDPNFFYVAAGRLQTPSTDPWGNVGV